MHGTRPEWAHATMHSIRPEWAHATLHSIRPEWAHATVHGIRPEWAETTLAGVREPPVSVTSRSEKAGKADTTSKRCDSKMHNSVALKRKHFGGDNQVFPFPWVDRQVRPLWGTARKFIREFYLSESPKLANYPSLCENSTKFGFSTFRKN